MSTLTRARCRLQAHPAALDAALAAGVLLCMVAGSFVDPHGPDGVRWGLRTPDPLSLVLMTLGAAALVFRRRAPAPSSPSPAPSPSRSPSPATPAPPSPCAP
ncbi:hypothetical protein SHKM778_72270 [Streptomyces sp. KM77-8]|uniref:PEP-CTERM sorting domain-containing protein n=1 Tax=Streptomyces haneummycinicus TaxID=3074435 RepID=A0AAT9HTD5_9ACTN